MKGELPCKFDLSLFEPHLSQLIEPFHPLSVLSDNFPWDDLEREYSCLYSRTGAPAKPIRLMAGLLILKEVFNGSDKGIVTEYARDPYFQHLCGGSVFIRRMPCSPGDLSHFRRRLGQQRLLRLIELYGQCQLKAGIDRLRINGKPGHENFSYSALTSIYFNLVKSFRNLAEKLTIPASRDSGVPIFQKV